MFKSSLKKFLAPASLLGRFPVVQNRSGQQSVKSVGEIGEYWSQQLVKEGLTSDGDVMKNIYDGWAKDYDRVTASWGYTGPKMVATRLATWFAETHEQSLSEAHVLDCGCGTGLGGEALFDVGFRDVDGCDVSPASLELIRATKSRSYNETIVVDMKQFPYPIGDDAYDGLICVGVFVHFHAEEMVNVFDEWTRILKPNAVGVFSHRSASMANDEWCVHEMADKGKWEILSFDKNQAYLAEEDNPGYSEHHEADYVVFRVL